MNGRYQEETITELRRIADYLGRIADAVEHQEKLVQQEKGEREKLFDLLNTYLEDKLLRGV